MNAFIFLADADSGGQIAEIARTFGVDWPHLFAQMVSFGIVCAVLYWFAYRPVLAMLQERRQRIEEGMANADKVKAELAQIEVQRQEILDRVNAQATQLIEEARAAAARVQQEETQKAIAAAQLILTKAREVAQQDHERMLAELKHEVGRLVVQTTAAVTGKILTPEDQQRLAEETARQVVG
jgi:F-type H+-transporting ATPase subunit b